MILATLDTKRSEAEYLRGSLERRGISSALIDTGFGRLDVQFGDTHAAIDAMARFAGDELLGLVEEGALRGVIGMGGARGTAVAVAAMKKLPPCVETLVVTAAAPAYVASLLDGLEIALIFSPVDLAGVNALTSQVLDRAAGAMIGVLENRPLTRSSGNLIGITALGVTSPAADQIRRGLVSRETVVFPALRGGLLRLRSAAASGQLDGLIHLTPQDLLLSTLAAERDLADWPALPTLVVPGSLDVRIEASGRAFPGRRTYPHAPGIVLVRTTREENVKVGRELGAHLESFQQAWALVYPGRGFSVHDRPGGVFEDPDADAAFLEGFRDRAPDDGEVLCVDAHIADDVFAAAVIEQWQKLSHREINREVST